MLPFNEKWIGREKINNTMVIEFLKDNKKKAKATLEYEERKDDYKQQVLEWINTIGAEEKRKYQEEHMKVGLFTTLLFQIIL